MQIVINIPDEQYSDIIKHYNTFPNEMKKWGLQAIKNGTPLPEGAEILTKEAYSDLCMRASRAESEEE